MALFTARELRAKGQQYVAAANSRGFSTKTAGAHLTESAQSESKTSEFDIFLAHAYLDATLVAGLKADIEDMGFSVYVDWIQDSHLDRANVDKTSVELLKSRLKQSKSLFTPRRTILLHLNGCLGSADILTVSRDVSQFVLFPCRALSRNI